MRIQKDSALPDATGWGGGALRRVWLCGVVPELRNELGLGHFAARPLARHNAQRLARVWPPIATGLFLCTVIILHDTIRTLSILVPLLLDRAPIPPHSSSMCASPTNYTVCPPWPL